MPRSIFAHTVFRDSLDAAVIEDKGTALQSLIDDKLRIICEATDLRRYWTKLKRERVKDLYGKLLHVHLRSQGRRLFCIVKKWPLVSGKSIELLLPLCITCARDELDYSNLLPYMSIADAICSDFQQGQKEKFEIWFPCGNEIARKPLEDWPFRIKEG